MAVQGERVLRRTAISAFGRKADNSGNIAKAATVLCGERDQPVFLATDRGWLTSGLS